MKIKSTFGPTYREVEIGDVVTLCKNSEIKLQSGAAISDFPVAYKTYGKLSEHKDNVILVCHALTGDQYINGIHPVTGKPGWWDEYVGDGKEIDTGRYCVLVPNLLGGCMGSFGPKTIDPETGKSYNLDFPVITIPDMVKVQKELLNHLGIEKLACVAGASMGGMQVLEWISKYPETVRSALVIAASAKHSAQNIAFNEIGRQAIMADPDWCEGNYIQKKKFPVKGLALARMMAHITYLSEDSLQKKFGRELQDKTSVSYGFETEFQVESYLRHQGISFVERFDPNTYLYITRAMDYFDLAADFGGNLSKAFENTRCPVLVISFTSDWKFTTGHCKQIVRALSATTSDVSFVEIKTDKGHDSFLMKNDDLSKTLTGFFKKVSYCT